MSLPTAESALLLAAHEPGVTPTGVAAWCARLAAEPARRGGALRVWLSGELCLDLLAEPGVRLGDAASLSEWARRLAMAYELDADGAVAGWRTGSGTRLREAACLLLAPARLEQIRADVGASGLRLCGVHPLWAGVLAAARGSQSLRHEGMLLVVEGRLVTQVRLDGAGIVAIDRHWLPEARAEHLAPLLARAAQPVVVAGHGLQGELPAGVSALGPVDSGSAELEHWLAAAERALSPDFLVASSPASRRLGWSLAGTAALVAGIAALEAGQAHAEMVQAEAVRVQRVEQAARAGLRAKVAAAGEARALAPTVLLQRLAHPWGPWFAAVDAASIRGVRWVSAEHQADPGRSRITGRAETLEQALAATRALAGAPVVADARMVRAQAALPSGVEFEVSVQLAGARQ